MDENNSNSLLYPAPHLHSHAVLLNYTADATGKPRALETGELFRVQTLMKSIYQSEIKYHLRELGYIVGEGKNGAAEILGYTKEYLDAESLRGHRIKARMEELGLSGPRASEIIAHQDRNEKLSLTPEEVRALHLARAEEFGNQPRQVVEAARVRIQEHRRDQQRASQESAPGSVSFAKAVITERLAVFDHFQLVANALRHGRGYVRVKEIERNIESRSEQTESMKAAGKQPELIAVSHARPNAPGRQYTAYLDRALKSVQNHGISLPAQYIPHISPLGWEHIAITGTYQWKGTESTWGRFRPLRLSALDQLVACKA